MSATFCKGCGSRLPPEDEGLAITYCGSACGTIQDLRAELAKVKEELGEWWRATCALEDAQDDEAERKALTWLHEIRIGNTEARMPPEIRQPLIDERDALRAELAAARERFRQFYSHALHGCYPDWYRSLKELGEKVLPVPAPPPTEAGTRAERLGSMFIEILRRENAEHADGLSALLTVAATNARGVGFDEEGWLQVAKAVWGVTRG